MSDSSTASVSVGSFDYSSTFSMKELAKSSIVRLAFGFSAPVVAGASLVGSVLFSILRLDCCSHSTLRNECSANDHYDYGKRKKCRYFD